MALAFFDDFNGPAGALPDPTKWKFWTGDHNQSELQWMTDQNATLDGAGNLAIVAKKEPLNTKAYTSSWVQTKGTVEPQYGLIEARIKMPKGAGLWPAFWMMGFDHDVPAGYWPKCGEIDITETLMGDRATTHTTIHGATVSGGHWQRGDTSKLQTRPWAGLDAFNVFGLRWEPGKMTFELNGVELRTYNNTDPAYPANAVWPFDKPMYLILSMAVGGWAGAPTPDTVFPATMLVDWVRVTPLPL